MQVNSINSNQSFGAIKFSPEAKAYVSKGARAIREKDFPLLKKLMQYQMNNPFNVELDVHYTNTLCGFVADGSTFASEPYFDGLFRSPMKLIKKLCKIADEQLAKSKVKETIEDIIG